MCSENPTGADNQQERLDAYLAGFVDGEGTFHVAVCRNASTTLGWQLVPEFHVSQNRGAATGPRPLPTPTRLRTDPREPS